MVRAHGRYADLLETAGYQEGDFFPVAAFSAANNTGATTSSTYTNVLSGNLLPLLRYDTLHLENATTQVVLLGNAKPSTDQIDIRLHNLDSSETITEQTGITTSGRVEIGPTEYEPPDTSTSDRYIVQIRNADNSTSVSIEYPAVYFGVKL